MFTPICKDLENLPFKVYKLYWGVLMLIGGFVGFISWIQFYLDKKLTKLSTIVNNVHRNDVIKMHSFTITLRHQIRRA